MSFAIKWEADETQAGGFLYFDAVTAFTKNYSGQVTKHPVDSGGSITDHFIRENPTFTLSAVFSGVDISTTSSELRDITGTQPYNTRVAPTAVSVNSTDQSVLTRFLPDSIGQFLPASEPDVVLDPSRGNDLGVLAETLSDLISGNRVNLFTGEQDHSIQEVTLYETNNNTLTRSIPKDDTSRLVITSIVFKEDAGTGFGLYCDITFEQVSFVYLKKTDIPKDVQDAIASKASGTSDKAKQDSTATENPDDMPAENDDDGFRTPYGEETDRKRFQLGQPLGV
jgi:hypothetical protein